MLTTLLGLRPYTPPAGTPQPPHRINPREETQGDLSLAQKSALVLAQIDAAAGKGLDSADLRTLTGLEIDSVRKAMQRLARQKKIYLTPGGAGKKPIARSRQH